MTYKRPLASFTAVRDILVVDDQYEITDLVKDFLVDEGYQVRVAHDGASAWLDIQQRRPGLVILDVSMPVMTGDDLLRLLRKAGSTVPIILMTAGHQPQIYQGLGANVILPKPFDLDTLLTLVEKYMQ
jgi:DNA-binding response OmpR family regulator